MKTFLLVVLSFGLFACSSSPKEKNYLSQARRLLREAPLIDGHNDLPWTIREEAQGKVEAYDIQKKSATDTDIPRLRQGGVGGQFWSVYIEVSKEAEAQGYAKTQLEQIDIARRMIDHHPDDFMLALKADDFEKALQQGKIASFLGIEGGHAIENSLGALRSFYRLGVRYMTLTHGKNLDWADSATDDEKLGGLSPFGVEVVKEMNRLGMLVDLSHVSAKVMHQALDVSKAPIIFSHSSARALTNHKRNVPDDVLKRVQDNGGIVMVTFVTGFVSQEVKDHWDSQKEGEEPRARLEQVADHIEHVRKVAGIDHVGIGGDYYGQDHLPVGLEDVSRYPYLFAELLRRGWSEKDLRKLANENILRVLRQAEKVAKRLQKKTQPSAVLFEERQAL